MRQTPARHRDQRRPPPARWLGCLLALCACGGAEDPAPTATASPVAIVYAARREGHYQLFRLPLAGGTPQPLTSDPGLHLHPSCAPDGRRVALTCEQAGQRGLCLIDADSDVGAPLALAPLLASTPSFSPDGRRLVFEGRRATDEQPDIYTVAADGLDAPLRLTADPGRDGGPVFAPDGATIYFVSDRSGSFELWRMRSDGAQPTVLPHTSGILGRPSVAPDGTWLAFARPRPGAQVNEIVRYDLSDGSIVTLTSEDDSEPAIAADGRQLVFTTLRFGQAELATLALERDASVARLTTDTGIDGSPAWLGPRR